MLVLTAVGVQLPTTSRALSYLFFILSFYFFKGEEQSRPTCSACLEKSKLRRQNIISDSVLTETMVDTGRSELVPTSTGHP